MDEEEALLIVDNKNNNNNNSRDIHILSISFVLIFLSFGAAQNLETTLNTVENLGTTCLGILYLSFTIFSIVAGVVVRTIGSKKALVLGTSGYWFFVAANLIPSWYTMIPASIYIGFCASIIWVGQGTYLTSSAQSHARENKLHEGTVIGHFNGEFWAMFAGHQVFGNLITLFVLKDGTGGSTTGTTLLFIIFLSVMTLGIILICFLSKKDNHKKAKESPESSLDRFSTLTSLAKSVFKPLCDVRMLLIIPLFAYSGLQQAFVWAEFTKGIVKPVLGSAGVGGAMAVYGAFDALSSLVAGRFTSGLSNITYIVCGGALAQAIIFLWILLQYSATSGLIGMIYPLIMAGVLGIGDGVLMTQLNALLGILFQHDMEGAFAQLKIWQSASIAAVFFLMAHITMQAMLVTMLAILCVSMVGFLLLTLRGEQALSSS
ncbi:hypothetical protein ACFE04_000929 [Oxalis oulophora]